MNAPRRSIQVLSAHVGAAARRAFTLLELLVVIAVIVVVVAVTVPAVARIVESANYAAAVNTVSAALGNARALAMQNGRHTGVAFLFDTETKRASLMVLELHLERGALTDRPAAGRGSAAVAFRPAMGAKPVTLPKGTAVYGLHLDPAWIIQEPFIDSASETSNWYHGELVRAGQTDETIPWLFPHSDARLFLTDDNRKDPWLNENGDLEVDRRAVRQAESFCVLFDPDGSIVTTLSIGFGADLDIAYVEHADLPRDLADPDRPVYDDPARFDPEETGQGSGALGHLVRRGTQNPEVKLRPVAQLAVVDLTRLASGGGVEAPWLLRAADATEQTPGKPYEDAGEAISGAELDDLVAEVSDWIDRNAEVIGFDRYTGAVLRRTNE